MHVKKQIAVAFGAVAIVFGLTLALAHARAADPAEIKVLCSTALRTVMQELAPQFERATGNKIVVDYGVSAAIQRRVEGGEPFDAIFLTVKQLDALVQEHKIAPGTRTPIAQSG